MNTQISKITTLFLNYPKMLCVWNATEFVFLSDDCVGFKVCTPTYKGTVIITWQDNAFYSVCFRDMELKILGISDAEKVLDAVEDYVEMGRCGCNGSPYLMNLNALSRHFFFCSIFGCTYRFSVVPMFEWPSSTLTVL